MHEAFYYCCMSFYRKMARIKKKKTQTSKANNEKKKMLMRKLRENIKNDPSKYEEAKRKERERYYARKQAGKIKTIDKMSPREQRTIRKNWRERSNRCYKNKKNNEDLERRLEENSPPPSPGNTLDINVPVVVEDKKTRIGKNKRRKNRRILKDKIKKLEEQLKIAKRKAEKYKKRAQRLDQTKIDTPTKNVKNLVKNQNVSPQIRKKLLFNEVMIKQMKENFKDRKKYRAVVTGIAGKIIKKYRMMSTLSKELSYNLKYDKRVKNVERKVKLRMTKKYVTSFLEKDECSRSCPGKKDTVTFKKDKRQKRYLNDSLFNLHKTFCLENPHLRISYATFCKVRPFWIVAPKVSERDTCLCVVHENMELLTNKLFNNKVIAQSSPRQICKVLCCEGDHLKEECLQRSCKLCKNNMISMLPSICEENSTIAIPQWVSKKVLIKVKGKEKTCTKSVKEELKITKKDSFDMLQKNIFKYMLHIRNMRHQQATIRRIKENLKPSEVFIHSDFSENYGCKYGREIQSAHFGGSKPQLSLHTVVIYYKLLESKDLSTKSFCTVTEDLRHDSFAVCAHLEPVIAEIKRIIPSLNTIHFLSDSVVNQYCNNNKTMFYLIGSYLNKISHVKQIRWHYSESGHGKGAPDGIGGCLKRNADDLVARGLDISSFDHFLFELRKRCQGVEIIPILKKDIDNLVNVNPINLETFKGTLKVHEITWSEKRGDILQARRLSCLDCDSSTSCHHYGIGQIQLFNMDCILLSYCLIS